MCPVLSHRPCCGTGSSCRPQQVVPGANPLPAAPELDQVVDNRTISLPRSGGPRLATPEPSLPWRCPVPRVASEAIVPSVRADSPLSRRGRDRTEQAETAFDTMLDAALPDRNKAEPAPRSDPQPQPPRRDPAPSPPAGRDVQATQRPNAPQAATDVAPGERRADAAEAGGTDAPTGETTGEDSSGEDASTVAASVEPTILADVPAQPAIAVPAAPAVAVAIPAGLAPAAVPASPEAATTGDIQAAAATPQRSPAAPARLPPPGFRPWAPRRPPSRPLPRHLQRPRHPRRPRQRQRPRRPQRPQHPQHPQRPQRPQRPQPR
jgi:hypothetical protein